MSHLSDWLTGQDLNTYANARAKAARAALAKALETDTPGPSQVLVKNLSAYHFGTPQNALVSSIVRNLSE